MLDFTTLAAAQIERPTVVVLNAWLGHPMEMPTQALLRPIVVSLYATDEVSAVLTLW